jgi:Cu/Ag efflux pump CusA
MNHEAEIIQTLMPYLMAFPQSKMNEGSLIVYARALSSLSIAEIDAAMLKLMRTVKFFPSVAEIFEQSANMKTFATGIETKSADEAWKEVLQEVHDAFIYRKPRFSSKEIEKTALNMGWRQHFVILVRMI